APGPLIRLEMFEGSTGETPIADITRNGFAIGMVEGAWQDLQGAIRITSVSEPITLGVVSIEVLRPGADGGMDSYLLKLSGSDLAVPEPSTLGLLGVGSLALLIYHARRRRSAVPPNPSIDGL